MVQAWVKDRSQHLAPASLEVAYRYLAAIFGMAVRDGLISKSPCVDIRRPAVEKPRVKPLATEAVEALVEAMPARYRALVVVGAGAGLRQGEAFGLTLPRVDFLRRTLHVEQQLVQVSGQPVYLRRPKRADRGASVRSIPMGDLLLTVLAQHLEQFPAVRTLPGVDGVEEALLFTDEAGQPIRRTSFSAKVWVPARKAAGLPEAVTFHDLRHYYASLLISQGASVKTVQARLGHKTAQETLETYTHLWPDEEDLTRAAVDRVLGAALLGGGEESQADRRGGNLGDTAPL